MGPAICIFFKIPHPPTPGDPTALPGLGFHPIDKHLPEMDSQPLLTSPGVEGSLSHQAASCC